MSEITNADGDQRIARRLLGAHRRQLTLEILSEEGDSMDIEELAAEIVARENASDTVDEDAIEGVTLALHHVHLPKLVDAGVHYDSNTRRMRLEEFH